MDCNGALRNTWKLIVIIVILLLIIVLLLIFHNATPSTSCSYILNQGQSKEPQLKLWPNARVPFTIDTATLDARFQQLIRKAIKGIEDKTCIRFIDKVSTADRNWINFVRDDHACVYPETVGMSDKENEGQNIVISSDCLSSGQIQRNLGLTLGLGFEETRPDRDSFVRYSPDLPECLDGISNLPNISKLHHPAAVSIFFDYYSHMFVETKCFRPIGSETSNRPFFGTRLRPNQSHSMNLGSSDVKYGGTFSVLDIEKLNAIYNCSGCHSYRFRHINKVTDKWEPFESFNPVLGGLDFHSAPLYICRTYHHGSLLTGKLVQGHLCYTASTNTSSTQANLFFKNFEVLTNPENVQLSWLHINGSSNLSTNMIVGGMTSARRQFYIGRCKLDLFVSDKKPVIPGFIFPGSTNASVISPYATQAQCSPVGVLVCKEE